MRDVPSERGWLAPGTLHGSEPVSDDVASQRRARTLAYTIAGAAVALAAVTLMFGVLNRGVAAGSDAQGWLRLALSATILAAPAALIAAQRPRHPVGWLLLSAALLLALAGACTQYGVYALATHPGLPAARWALLIPRLTALIDIVPPLVLLLFPTGALLSPRWRPIVWAAALAGVVVAIAGAFDAQALLTDASAPALRHVQNPLGIRAARPLLDAVVGVGMLVLVVCPLAAVVALVLRYRASEGTERAQLKWFVYAGSTLVGYLIVGAMLPSPIDTILGTTTTAFVAAAIAIAILRYRLFDIDLIINRTLVYGALSAGVAGMYIAVVAGFGALVNAKSSLAVALLATALVAAGFSPARNWLQAVVDRMMYRGRPDPYQVLARLGQQLEAAALPEEVLPGLAEVVGETLHLPYVAIATTGSSGGATLTSYGTPAPVRVELPLTYHNQRIGTLVAGRRRGDSFSSDERALLADLARQAGVAVHAIALTADLHRSRERLVVAREEERRRIRRDLHDGLGPTLAAITMRADVARRAVRANPDAAEEAMTAIKEQAQLAIADVRRLVQNLRPPALDELGLVGALKGQAERFAPGVEITVTDDAAIDELAASVEVAAYRITDEALTNAIKHAHAAHVRIHLTLHARTLQIEIRDDGTGFDPDATRAGLGLSTMHDRAEELGGTCTITAAQPHGTVVHATLPLIPTLNEP